MRPVVFLDRDNTLIDNDGDLWDPGQVHLLDGVSSSLARLHGAGHELVVVTNQGAVARGRCTVDQVEQVNHRIAELVETPADPFVSQFVNAQRTTLAGTDA